MSDENDKALEAVTRMIKLTQQGKLQWTTEDLGSNRNIENNLTAIYYTTYKDRSLRLYKARIEEEDSGGSSGYSGFFLELGAGGAPRNKIILEFVDDYGRSLWMFPSMPALKDLLAAVQYRIAGVSDFLDEILSEQ